MAEYIVKPDLNCHSQKDKNCFQDRLSLNKGQRYCRMLQVEENRLKSKIITSYYVCIKNVLKLRKQLYFNSLLR